jgi:FLVCR family MFS transporter 7
MLLSGIIAAIVTSPIFDRVLTHHLGVTVRTLCPIVGVAWLSVIWAGTEVPFPFSLGSLCSIILTTVRPHNVAALFAIFVVIGVCSITLLPVAIELGVELTRNPDGSSAVLWFLCALSFRY